MRPLLVVAVALAAAGVGTVAQTVSSRYQIPIWDSTTRQYVFTVLGPSLAVSTDKVLSVRLPVRVIGKALTWDATALVWRFPTGVVPSNVAVYVNGLRYMEGQDYVIKGGAVVPLQTSNWPEGNATLVQADWEQ